MGKKLWLRCHMPLVPGSLCDFTDFPIILLSPPLWQTKLWRVHCIRRQLALHTLCGIRLEVRQLGILCAHWEKDISCSCWYGYRFLNWPKKITLVRVNSPEHGKERRQDSSRGSLRKVCRQREGNRAVLRVRMDLSRERNVFGHSYWSLKRVTWLTSHLRRQFWWLQWRYIAGYLQ